jgi:hypothetical protein
MEFVPSVIKIAPAAAIEVNVMVVEFTIVKEGTVVPPDPPTLTVVMGRKFVPVTVTVHPT